MPAEAVGRLPPSARAIGVTGGSPGNADADPAQSSARAATARDARSLRTAANLARHAAAHAEACRCARERPAPRARRPGARAGLDNRVLWDEHMSAYGEAIGRTSTDVAPWYVVPADRKWYRNWAISTLLLEALGGLGLAWPTAAFDVDAERRRLQAMP